MSLTPQQLAELDSLLSDLADERLSEERRLVLEGLLQSEPEARDYYIQFLALCSDLHESAATCLSVENEDGPHVAASLRDADAGLGETGPRGSLGRRWPAWIAMVTAVAVLAAVIVSTRRPSGSGTANLPEAQPVVGHIFDIVGLVEIAAEELSGTPATDGMPVRSGEALLTKGADSHVAIRLDDGTVIMLAGDTRVAFPLEDRDRLDVEYGNVTATVQPRPAGHPLLVCTREAQLEVLGTRLSVACGDRRTRVDVLEGDIRVTRLSDQRSVALAGGQSAEISPQADLKPAPIAAVPDIWSLDFNDGLPPGWHTGQLVFNDLPEGSRAVARTAAVEENGQRRYQLRSHNAWSKGLFTLHDDSWIHIRYRLEKPGTFLLYVVSRQHDFGEPVCTVLTPGNLQQTEPNRWHTLTLPLNQFRRARARDIIPLQGQLVAFCLVFDSPEHNPGLTVDRIWVTRGMPAEPRLPIESSADRSAESAELR